MLFVFDGIDGAGKSTQIERLKSYLGNKKKTIVCKDPGSTQLGEALRAILLNKGDRAGGEMPTDVPTDVPTEMPIDMRSEMMLFSTARTQLVQEIIKPALQQSHFVILDRFVMSTIVYQGHAGKLDPEDIRTVNQFATDGLRPDHTFVLDIPVDVAMKRLGDTLDRMESRGVEYFSAVRSGFLTEANKCGDCSVIDATKSVDQIAADIRAAVDKLVQ